MQINQEGGTVCCVRYCQVCTAESVGRAVRVEGVNHPALPHIVDDGHSLPVL
jgi:hypothetical protein